jgi:hypothetical protein
VPKILTAESFVDTQDDDDPIVGREVWYEIVGNLFSRLGEADPEKYNLARIREATGSGETAAGGLIQHEINVH